MSGPTREQLLALVDQAEEQHRLTAAEAALLRVGITILDESRRQVGGLQTALHTARRERDTLRAELNRRGHPAGPRPPQSTEEAQ
ncbi:hypothetical protein ABZ419_11325 [Streptomyces cinnamoneus]|uniref:hypothetical protein n=1 Tax=Streptomyces cinnamoneus TaxID=53446 RepID=UPI0034031A7E